MRRSFNSSRSGDFSFDRRDCLRLALESLKSAMPMLDRPTIADREWFNQRVREIFEPHLPPPGSSTGWSTPSSSGQGRSEGRSVGRWEGRSR
jgi:hypothetical protein